MPLLSTILTVVLTAFDAELGGRLSAHTRIPPAKAPGVPRRGTTPGDNQSGSHPSRLWEAHLTPEMRHLL